MMMETKDKLDSSAIVNYRQAEGLSGSRLAALTCPAKFKWEVDNPLEPTDAMKLGSLRHCMLLEPNRVDELFYWLPEGMTRRGKAYEECLEAAGDKCVVKYEDWQECQAMVDTLLKDKTALCVLADCSYEQEYYWEEDGIQCKGKIDVVNEQGYFICDYKTTNDASPGKFKWTIKEFGYLLQLAHYQKALANKMGRSDLPGILILAQEYDAPYVSQVYAVPQALLDEAHAKRKELMQVYKTCIETGVWGSYSEEIIDL